MENYHSMKKPFIKILTISIIITILTSCSTFSKQNEEDPSDNEVQFYYRIRGEGPDGTAFGWKEVNSQYVILTDLRIGQWTLYAEKLDPKGNKIATGEVTTFINDSSEPTEIPFTTGGLGDVVCNITWGKDQCIDPELSIFILSTEGEWFPRPKEEIQILEDGLAVWNANAISSGSYSARITLSDGKKEIAGAVSALRVVDGYISQGNINLTIGCRETPYGVRIGTDPIFKTDGIIEIEGINAIYKSPEGEPTEVTWYINGIETSTSESLKLNTSDKQGCYRLDAVSTTLPKASSSITIWLKDSGLQLLESIEDSSIGFTI